MQSDTAKKSLLNEETKRKQKINQGHFCAFECFLFCLIFFCSKYALPPFRLRPDKSVLSGNLNSRSRHKLQSSSTSLQTFLGINLGNIKLKCPVDGTQREGVGKAPGNNFAFDSTCLLLLKLVG